MVGAVILFSVGFFFLGIYIKANRKMPCLQAGL